MVIDYRLNKWGKGALGCVIITAASYYLILHSQGESTVVFMGIISLFIGFMIAIGLILTTVANLFFRNQRKLDISNALVGIAIIVPTMYGLISLASACSSPHAC